jgi:hypothetical protein
MFRSFEGIKISNFLRMAIEKCSFGSRSIGEDKKTGLSVQVPDEGTRKILHQLVKSEVDN